MRTTLRALLGACPAFAIMIILLLSASFSARAEGFADGKKREYRIVSVDGEEESDSRRLYTVTGFTWWVEDGTFEGEKVNIYRREEKTKEGEKLEWWVILKPEKLSLMKVERKITSRSGKLMVHDIEYYGETNEYFPDNSFHFHMLPLAVQTMDLSEDAKNDAYFAFSPEQKPWHIIIHVEDREQVTVPAGTFNCVKLKLEFDTDELTQGKSFFSRIFSALFPDYYVWVDENHPHTMVKLQGKLNGVTQPDMAHELIEVTE